MGHRTPETIQRYLGPATQFDLQIWGSYWDEGYWAEVYAGRPEENRWHRHWRGPLPMGETAALYSSAEIVLGFHETTQREWGMWNNRTFEALACGALLVSDEAEGLAAEFGDAVVTTSGGDHLASTLRDLLADPAERARRRELGRSRVLEWYTYGHWAARVHAFADELATARAAVSMRA
jgi:glycosyltransferase involved in cell wall biosynthesis